MQRQGPHRLPPLLLPPLLPPLPTTTTTTTTTTTASTLTRFAAVSATSAALDGSADCLANTKADAAVARVECTGTLELAKRRAGERICQVKEKLRRTRIKAERLRAGWTRLYVAV